VRVTGRVDGYEQAVSDQYNPPDAEQHPRFAIIAKALSRFTGSWWAVAVTLVLVLAWVAVGFMVDFSRAWELSMVAGLPVLTLLLLIMVQHTQNHDNLAMQLKLDEIIRAHESTEDEMMRVEDASYEHLEDVERDFKSHVERHTERRAPAQR
jgi:low affinity Fe/Cu permease